MFQSTHLREVRRCWCSRVNRYHCFNPRTCVRCEKAIFPTNWRWSGFNPRTCVRCEGLMNFCNTTAMFQSTHLREVRSGILTFTPENGRFNPRTCVRCEVNYYLPVKSMICFNPRTCVRCEVRLINCQTAAHVSIHAPA